MKKIVAVILTVCALAMPVSAFDYSILDGMTVEELKELEAKVQERLNVIGVAPVDSQLTDSGDIFSFTVTDARIEQGISNALTSTFPKDGNVFLIVDLEVRNISNADDYLNTFFFDCYADDYSVDIYENFSFYVDFKRAAGDIRAGKILAGSLIFEVSKEWKKLEICYKEGGWGDGKIIEVTVTPDIL